MYYTADSDARFAVMVESNLSEDPEVVVIYDTIDECVEWLDAQSDGQYDNEGFDAEWYVPEDELPYGYSFLTYYIDTI